MPKVASGEYDEPVRDCSVYSRFRSKARDDEFSRPQAGTGSCELTLLPDNADSKDRDPNYTLRIESC